MHDQAIIAFWMFILSATVNGDPCETNFGGCDKLFGLCWGTGENTHYCTCKAGFQPVEGATEHKCIDTNECMEEGVCDKNALCENSYGSYTCTCRCGYVMDYTGRHCLDASMITDLCMVPRTCYHEFLWLSTWFDQVPFDKKYGKRRYIPDPLSGTVRVRDLVETKGICECQRGFRINKCGYCEDVDECSGSNDLCPDTASFCVNTEGSYYCDCEPGYVMGPCKKKCYTGEENVPFICDSPQYEILSSVGISSSTPSYNQPHILFNWRTCADEVKTGELVVHAFTCSYTGHAFSPFCPWCGVSKL